jgi:hypothetical protein
MRYAVDESAATSPPQLNLRRLERIQRWLQYIAGFVLLIFIVSIFISYFELRRIRRDIAERQDEVRKLNLEIDKRRTQVKSQLETIESQSTSISVLQEATIVANEANPNQPEQKKETIEKSIAQTGDARPLPVRIYLQIAREEQRKKCAQVARQLQTRGYLVPGIENVREKAPNKSELRFCPKGNSVDEDLAGITDALKAISISVNRVRLSNCQNVRSRHYEIWFSEEWGMPKELPTQSVKQSVTKPPK